MTELRIPILAMAVVSLVLPSTVLAQDGFDNPGQNGQPCLAIQDHDVSWRRGDEGERRYSSRTRIENLCRFPLEFQLCLSVVGGDEPVLCQEGMLRASGSTAVRVSDVNGRLTGPSPSWRYLQ